jgi:hypothetical protein
VLPVIVLAVSAVAAASLVFGLSSRSHLSGARQELDVAWNDVRPALDQRYHALAQAAAAVRSRLGDDRALLAEIDHGVSTWAPAAGAVEDQVRAAVRLEGLAARLRLLVAATPRLRSSGEIGHALDAFNRSDPGISRQKYNEAAGAYEEVRGGFPRRLVAGALGFDASRTLEVSA